MQCEILTTETELQALAPEWEALERRCGKSLFSAYEWMQGWWRHLGKPEGYRLHIVAGRRGGTLVALAPLAVIRRKGVRLLEWAGAITADYSDFLLEDTSDAAALWAAVRKSRHFDLARIREVHPDALCLSALAPFARLHKESAASAIRIAWPAFDGWLASLPYSARKQYRARIKQAEAIGPLRYDVLCSGSVPEQALETLVTQKTAWAKALGKRGIFDAAGVGAFFRHIFEAEARRGRLHFSTLTCKDEIIAVHLGFVKDGIFLSYMPSYSQAWNAVSPGKLLMFKCMGWAIENGCAEYDFMRGEEGYKNSFATDARMLKDFVFARTLKGRLAQFFYVRRRQTAPQG